jgi:hypothetical protein
VFCDREQRPKLIQYVENISLAQNLVYPLLAFDAAILAVTAVVCGAMLITGEMDEGMTRGLVGLIGTSVKHALACRKVTCTHINLQNLVVTGDEAEAKHRESVRAEKARRRQAAQAEGDVGITAAAVAAHGHVHVDGAVAVHGDIDAAWYQELVRARYRVLGLSESPPANF